MGEITTKIFYDTHTPGILNVKKKHFHSWLQQELKGQNVAMFVCQTIGCEKLISNEKYPKNTQLIPKKLKDMQFFMKDNKL